MVDPLIGSVLGDYEILDLMGQGGMARVYRGYDPRLQRYAAVKVTAAAVVPDDLQDEYEARFIREARAIARLHHPNIVGIYQFAQQAGLNFMAMHFIEGQDLRHLLADYHARGQVMPDEKILCIIRDMASALDYAHANGVIHRDIKPSNIMVTPQGQAILTDFGLALNVPDGTVGRTFGSAHYIAPEQAISSARSVPQSDLYALGVVLYEMATGRVPFDSPSTMSIALMHLNEPPPLPSSLYPLINPHLETVILQLLRKRPEDRFPNGAALVQALWDAFAVPVQPAAPPLSAPDPRWDDSASWDDEEALVDTAGKDAVTLLLASQAPRPPRGRWLLGGLVMLALAVMGMIAGARQWEGPWSPHEKPPLAATGSPAAATPAAAFTPTVLAPSAPVTSTGTTALAETAVPTIMTTSTGITASTLATAPAMPPDAQGDTDLLLLYDADTILIVNQSSRFLNIQPLEFRRTNSTGGPDIFFKVEDLRHSTEPPGAFAPDHCFQLIRMDLERAPAEVPYDDTACAVRIGWRRLSPARWFWMDAEPGATFEVVSPGRVLAECKIDNGWCAIALP